MSLATRTSKRTTPVGGGALTITTPVAMWLRTAGAASASFSVTSGTHLILVGIGQWNGTIATPTNSGTAFTWTQRAANTGTFLFSKIYSAPAIASQSMTVTLGAGGGNDSWGMIWVVSGHHASPFGVTGSITDNTTNSLTVSYTASAAGSCTFIAAHDFEERGAATSSNLLDINNGNYTGIVDAICGYRLNTAAGATSLNLDAFGTSTAGWNHSYLELLAA